MIPTFNTFDITHVVYQAFFPMMGKLVYHDDYDDEGHDSV